jgi:hypothetical protein
MQIVLLTLAGVAAFLWLRSRKTSTTPIPPAGDPPMPPMTGFQAIPNNPTTPTTPGQMGTRTAAATGPTMAAGFPSSKTSMAKASGLKTATPKVAQPSGPELPDATVPSFRSAVSVIDSMLSSTVASGVTPIPPMPISTIDKMTTQPGASVIDQILADKQVMQ